jgi:ribonuclease HI
MALGNWNKQGHQMWSSYYDPTIKAVCIQSGDGWTTHLPIFRHSGYSTRSSTKPWYSLASSDKLPSPPQQLYVAIILIDQLIDDALFQISISSTSIPIGHSALQPEHINIDSDGAQTPHPYYLELLQWDTTSISLQVESIALAITTHDLHICADGVYHKTVGQGAHAWVFSTGTQDILWRGAGPALGHSEIMTSYRAELAGLTSVLFMLHWVCKQVQIDDGKIVIYCDNEAAMNEAFYVGLPSNNPYSQLAADNDLITLARDLLLQLPMAVKVTHQWVKGHYKGKRELWHKLNHLADELAGDLNSVDRPKSRTSPTLTLLYEAELLHQNQVITSRLPKVIRSALHDNNLQLHIIKWQSWSKDTFDKVDWEAHRMAYESYKRTQRISISKLIHGLYHTRQDAHKLYGTDAKCTFCMEHPETLSHVFRCQATKIREHRGEARLKLQDDLEKQKTPEKLMSALLHSLHLRTGI